MAPVMVLAIAVTLLRILGTLGVPCLKSWVVCLRGGLAAMFLVTGVSHFVGMRDEMVQMVPPALPAPGLLVTLTGVLELLGAAGLLVRRTSGWAAAGLFVLLVVMFPANVHAALNGSSDAMPLMPRTLIQMVFLAATGMVAATHLAARREVATPARS